MANDSINPKLIERGDKAISPTQSSLGTDHVDFILDQDWIRTAFMISDSKLEDTADIVNRYWSSASAKFTDTRLGCNIGINPRPQFTRYSDIRVKGRLAGRNNVSLGSTTGNFGMGRYYSEAIDDPSHTVYMRFGVPQFNSLSNFLSKAFDYDAVSLARTGRAPSAFYRLGQFAGTITALVAFPKIVIGIAVGRMVKSFFARPVSKFYTMKPTMHTYWSAVNNLVDGIAIYKGILPRIMTSEAEQRIGNPVTFDQDYLSELSRLMPDVFTTNNHFDIYSIANRAQRIANRLFHEDYERLNNGTPTDFTGYVKKDVTGNGAHPTYISESTGDHSIGALFKRVASLGYFLNSGTPERMEVDPKIDPKNPKGSEKTDPSWWSEFMNFFDAEFADGSQFAAFKVAHVGNVQESFGSSVIESDLSQKLNTVSSQIREARFSFSDGNLMGDGVLGGMVQGALGAVKDVAMGALDGVTMGFSNLIAGLGGSGFIDIPKHWQSSTASLPKISYSMKLISPYGNVISQMQNIYIPLAMILAGALPLSTGKQSYTSPFLCQIFDRGRAQIRLGMIESLSITRGTSNLPFDLKGSALAIDVTFTVADLSSIMHMPISNGVLGTTDMTLDEDNILSDYIATLSGLSIYDQVYALPKAKLTLAKKIMNLDRLTSPGYWASMFHESSTSGALQYLTFGVFNALELAQRGSEITAGSKR